jgi:hypothetical protein
MGRGKGNKRGMSGGDSIDVGREVREEVGSFKVSNSGEEDLFNYIKSSCLKKHINSDSVFYPEEEYLSFFYDGVGIKGSIFVGLTKIISKVGFPLRWRNKGVFMVALGLKRRGFWEPDILNLLTPGFLICQHIGDHEFSREEFERTVKYACKLKYVYCVGFENKKWDWKGFLG